MNKKHIIATLIAASLLAGCGDKVSGKSAPVSPLVTAQPVSLIDYQQGKKFVGRTEAIEDVAITAQVSGYLKERYFDEGKWLKKDSCYFKWNPLPMKQK